MSNELSQGQRRRHAQDLANVEIDDDYSRSFVPTLESTSNETREAQNAIRVARNTALDSMFTARTINRVQKTADDKSFKGRWTNSAQICLRSAVLLAGAGLDRSLKQLVTDSIEHLVSIDDRVQKKLESFAEKHLSTGDTGSIDPRSLVRILLGSGDNPKAIIINNWCYALTDSSAQSAERVDEIASALAITDETIRKRTRPTKDKSSLLEKAFTARNQIAHELDIVNPEADVRRPFERIQRTRKVDEVRDYVRELIDISQLIISNVDNRLRM